MSTHRYDVDLSKCAKSQKRGSCGDQPHPNRCQGTTFRTRRQCFKWALKGDFLCLYHRNKAKGQQGTRKGMAKRNSLYRKAVSGTLGSLLDEATEAAEQYDKERTDLSQEIDTARALAAQSLSLLSAATEKADTLKTETMLSVIQFSQNSMSLVSELMMKFQKMRISSAATLNHTQIEHSRHNSRELFKTYWAKNTKT